MNVLVLTHRLPYAPNRGDRIRAFHMIKLLAARADVHVISLVHDRAEQAEAGTLAALGVQVTPVRVPKVRNALRAAGCLVTRTPLTHVLLGAPGLRAAVEAAVAHRRPDVVFAYCSGVAPAALAPPLCDIPLVLDLVDVDSAKWAAYARASSPPRSWVFGREARCLADFEARAARAAYATLVVNARECDALLEVCPDARAAVVPNGVDVAALAPPPAAAQDQQVIFTGVFDYAPNVAGAQWLARDVWPRVRAALPAARLTLAGANPARAVRQLAASDGSIEVTGAVPDMRPRLWNSAVAVAPLFQARGVQNKVLEAVAAGLPAVVTRAVWDGLPAAVLPACRRADGAAPFAAALMDLLSLAPAERRRVAGSARLHGLSWPQRLAPLLALVEGAAARAGGAPRHLSTTSGSRSRPYSSDRAAVRLHSG